MAKNKTHESVTVLVALWQIGVLWAKNFSRQATPFNPNAPKTKDLIESINRHGIQDDRPVVVVKATEDEVNEMVAERQTILQNMLAIFQDKPTKENEHALKVRQHLWLDEKGLVRRPLYRVVSGNTRVSATPFALVKRAIEDGTFEYERVIGEPKWAAKIYDSLTQSELVQLQALENELNKTGTTEPSIEDKYLNVLTMVGLGCSESDVRKIYKDGTGRRLYYAAVLTNRFPGLQFRERFLSSDESFMFNLSKIHHSDDRPVVVRTDKDLLEKENTKLLAAGSPLWNPMTEADVFEWMEAKMGRRATEGAKKGPSKMLDKTKIQNVAANSPNAIVKAAMSAVSSGDMSSIEAVMPLTDGINALTRIGPNTVLFAALSHLSALSEEDRNEAIDVFSKNVSAYQIPSTKESTVSVE